MLAGCRASGRTIAKLCRPGPSRGRVSDPGCCCKSYSPGSTGLASFSHQRFRLVVEVLVAAANVVDQHVRAGLLALDAVEYSSDLLVVAMVTTNAIPATPHAEIQSE